MPIIFQQGVSQATGATTTKVSDIMNCVSQDIRQVLNPNAGISQATDLAILIDYTNRISLQMLRFSNWKFLQSGPQLFVTCPGVTDYWIGNLGSAPYGAVDTGIGLNDLQRIKQDAIFNRGNNKALSKTDSPPLNQTLQLAQRPLFWRNDVSTPYVLNIYPPPDGNAQQPNVVPMGPIATFAAGGALPLRTYFVKTAFVDSTGGVSGASIEQTFVVPANFLMTLRTPIIEIAGATGIVSLTTASGVAIHQWNVYASSTSASETLQAGPIQIGTDWTEPTSGLTSSGPSWPQTPTIAPLGGYVIDFSYFKARATLTQVNQIIQIPDIYKDIVCAGVNYLAFKYLKKDDEAQVWQGIYQHGLVEMVKDMNLAPRGMEFIRPDPYSVTLGINTGVGLDSGMETSLP